jgi:hypothetical protein
MFSVCTPILANDKETTLGLLGYVGGILLSAYVDYLEDATGGLIQTVPGFAPGTVPEPGTYALMLLGAGLIGATTRRKETI